jgi:hypothetical protein
MLCTLCFADKPLPNLQGKAILMALYFGGDHFVWTHQIGIVPENKTAAERWQKISLYS